MHYSVRVLSISTAYLSLTSLAGAQTSTTPEPPLVQSSAAATGQVESSPPTTPSLPPPTTPTATPVLPPTPPAAPATPIAPGTSSVAAPPSPALSPMPTVPVTQKSRARDCARDWIRQGFYLRFGSGFGSVNLSGNGPKGTASLSGLGSSSLLAIGGKIVGGLVLAGTIQASSITTTFAGGPFVDQSVTSNGKSLTASSKADASSSLLGLLVDWYPNLSDGWHVGLSGGVGTTSVRNHADDSMMTGTSTAGSAFGGYDWAIGPEWSLGLALVGSTTLSASMKDSSDQPDTGYRLKSYFVGISGSFLYF